MNSCRLWMKQSVPAGANHRFTRTSKSSSGPGTGASRRMCAGSNATRPTVSCGPRHSGIRASNGTPPVVPGPSVIRSPSSSPSRAQPGAPVMPPMSAASSSSVRSTSRRPASPITVSATIVEVSGGIGRRGDSATYASRVPQLTTIARPSIRYSRTSATAVAVTWPPPR